MTGSEHIHPIESNGENGNNYHFVKRRDNEAVILKVFFIIATVALGVALFSALTPIESFIVLALAGPVWNTVDGLGLFTKDTGLKNSRTLHGTFDYLLLGIVGLATLIYGLAAFVSHGTLFSSLPLQILIGPIGCGVFAITGFWLAVEEADEAYKMLNEAHKSGERSALINAYEKLTFDVGSWLFAGAGATVITAAAIIAFFNLPLAGTLMIVGFVTYALAASIKLTQLVGVSHLAVAYVLLPNNAVQSSTLHMHEKLITQPVLEGASHPKSNRHNTKEESSPTSSTESAHTDLQKPSMEDSDLNNLFIPGR